MTSLPIFARIGVGGATQSSPLQSFFEGSDFQTDMEFYSEQEKKVVWKNNIIYFYVKFWSDIFSEWNFLLSIIDILFQSEENKLNFNSDLLTLSASTHKVHFKPPFKKKILNSRFWLWTN